ncbi:TPA: hypothetical protein DIV48_02490 [Candidatus Kaiserbacteria bacterium]|nr:hypothetical protein [Candidatus Kaiserbacteria bacterium]
MLLFIAFPAFGAEEEKELGLWVEAREASRGPSEVIGWYERELSPSVGWFASAVALSDRYRNIYAGPYWKPTDWLQLGVGVGRENQPPSSMRSAFFSVETDRFHSFGVFESGGSGRWYRVHAVYDIGDRFSIGGMTERDIGIGPRVEYALTKNVSIWAAALRGSVPRLDEEEGTEKKSTVLFAVNFSF